MQLSAWPKPPDTRFALAMCEGLTAAGQKRLSPEFFYDEVGSALFEVITLLPEYGLTRADSRLLAASAGEIAARVDRPCSVIELGSGTGTKTAHILKALAERQTDLEYFAIDLSPSALDRCRRELFDYAQVNIIEAGFLEGVRSALPAIPPGRRILVLFLGSTIGNFDRAAATGFLRALRGLLKTGDQLLLGTDLVKPVEQLLLAYDDPAGVTAAFNLNLLARINRELGGDFDLRRFRHMVRYDHQEARVEMHLQSLAAQQVTLAAAGCKATFEAGETIWTESSHKYTAEDLCGMAGAGGFRVSQAWIDPEWPFAENLWQAA